MSGAEGDRVDPLHVWIEEPPVLLHAFFLEVLVSSAAAACPSTRASPGSGCTSWRSPPMPPRRLPSATRSPTPRPAPWSPRASPPPCTARPPTPRAGSGTRTRRPAPPSPAT
ncbi:hypothetical protein SEVIR_5G454602v4 [Setaria viridis]